MSLDIWCKADSTYCCLMVRCVVCLQVHIAVLEDSPSDPGALDAID